MELNPAVAARLARLLEERTGQSLAPERCWRIEPALADALADSGLPGVDAVLRRIAEGDEALTERVVEALLNHETSFFRDQPVFAQLVDRALPRLAAARASSRRLRIWCAGCATGQEPYSLALVFHRDAACWAGWTIDILGTDVSAMAIGRARAATYSQFEVQRGLSIRLMLSAFETVEGGWQMAEAVRRRVRFLRHSLLDPPPAGEFDLVLCRNVLMYFAIERRADVLARIAGAMAPDGLLMMGAGETMLGQGAAFAPDGELRGLYRPQPAATPLARRVA